MNSGSKKWTAIQTERGRIMSFVNPDHEDPDTAPEDQTRAEAYAWDKVRVENYRGHSPGTFAILIKGTAIVTGLGQSAANERALAIRTAIAEAYETGLEGGDGEGWADLEI